MLRMIGTKLKEWIKNLSQRIHPGSGEGDVEIGGKLTVDGDLKVDGGTGVTADYVRSNCYYDSGYNQFAYISISGSDVKWYFPSTYHFNGKSVTFSTPVTFAQNVLAYVTFSGIQIDTTSSCSLKNIVNQIGNVRLSFNGENREWTLNATPGGTATLLYNCAEIPEKIFTGKMALHLNLTEALGSSTSAQITLTKTDGESLADINATGVLMNGDTLVGVCHLKGTNANNATLSYQNALGTDLQVGEYTANLQLILPN